MNDRKDDFDSGKSHGDSWGSKMSSVIKVDAGLREDLMSQGYSISDHEIPDSYALRLAHPAHLEVAARAVALGAVALHGFANIYVLTGGIASGKLLNTICGFPAHEPPWVTTPPGSLDAVVDWNRLPDGLEAWEVRAVISELITMGPIGIRLPALASLPNDLVTIKEGVRGLQVMLAGVGCSSEGFLDRATELVNMPLLAIRPACHANLEGSEIVEEPVHHRFLEAVGEFGDLPGVVSLGRDDDLIERKYLAYAPTRPSVLSFQGIRFDRRNRPLIPIECHGSLALERMTAVLDNYDLGHVVLPSAQRRLAARLYQ
ncbi:MAG: hypothetical protein ACSLFB_08885 [Acidimicrobiales bacterium]